MKKYAIAATLFIINNEVISLIVLLVMAWFFIFDLINANERRKT